MQYHHKTPHNITTNPHIISSHSLIQFLRWQPILLQPHSEAPQCPSPKLPHCGLLKYAHLQGLLAPQTSHSLPHSWCRGATSLPSLWVSLDSSNCLTVSPLPHLQLVHPCHAATSLRPSQVTPSSGVAGALFLTARIPVPGSYLIAVILILQRLKHRDSSRLVVNRHSYRYH